MDFVTAIPSPLFVVTTYKRNGKTNACIQSWAAFSGNEKHFYAVLTNVSRRGHLCRTVHETGEAVISFPSADIYDRCMATIRCNGEETDEIAAAGLTAEPAETVHAPRIAECFMHLECRYLWDRAIMEGDDNVLMCFEVVAVCADEERLAAAGRYGRDGYLYNVHYPVDPERYAGRSHDSLAVLETIRELDEY
ncbi:MAG: flavin reductase [Clostridia bacterium]|nr:flavin reductase [Clostridia bacterium]